MLRSMAIGTSIRCDMEYSPCDTIDTSGTSVKDLRFLNRMQQRCISFDYMDAEESRVWKSDL